MPKKKVSSKKRRTTPALAPATEHVMKKLFEEVTREQLIADFKVVVADAEALLKATANHGGAEIAEIRDKAESSIKAVKAGMADAQTALVIKSKDAVKAADTFIHDNPWQAVGFAASVGLVLGLLGSRR